MTEFSIGDETGSYQTGLITLPDGRCCGIEDVVRLTIGTDTPVLDLLGTLRGALPTRARLAMPLRLAVSTVRAGLGAIGDELGHGSDRVAVELVMADGSRVDARMPPVLAAAMRRDREVVLAALARSAPVASPEPGRDAAEPEGTAAALTSIFRYEKRNGRLRRVNEPDKAE